MKINTFKKQWMLPVLGCAAMITASQSEAAVVVTFEQVGADVVACWSGTIDPGTWTNDSVIGFSFSSASATSLGNFAAGNDTEFYAGTATDTGLGGGDTPAEITSATGGTYGFSTTSLNLPGVANTTAPASTSYTFDPAVHKMTFANQTLAGINASSFNDTLAFTTSAGDTISYTTIIPEPSSVALLGLGSLGLLLRRRK